MDPQIRQVDHSAIKTGQTLVASLAVLAFVLDSVLILASLAAVMIISVLVPKIAPFTRLYQHLLKPAGLVRPHIVPDNPEPHRFALGLGATFMTAAAVLLAVDLAALGWALGWIVAVLAALNVLGGFCTGCFIYYQLNRLGVPGFQGRPAEQS